MAGLGNLILRDDGVGVHAIRRLGPLLPSGVLAAEIGTAVLDALHLVEWADRIVAIDAMQAGGDPGSIYLFGPEDAEGGAVRQSLHEVNLLALRNFLRRPLPEMIVLGVEPAVIEFGLDLSPRVAASLAALTATARSIALDWSRHPGLTRAELRARHGFLRPLAPAGSEVVL